MPPARLRAVRTSLLALSLPVVMLATAHRMAVSALIDAPNQGRVPPASAAPEGGEVLRVTRFDGAVIEAFVFEPEEAPRGTVLLFHGLRDRKDGYVSLARDMTARGFRGIAVDLRGHGASSGDYLTYGLADRADMSALLDTLEERGVELGPVGLVGASYGGATALQLAAHDRRVRAVATLETFAHLRDLLPIYAHAFVPFLPTPPDWFISWGLYTAHDRTGFDLETSDSTQAIRAFDGPVLLQHGEGDGNIPIAQAEMLREACGARCQLVRVPDRNHVTLLSDGAVWDRAFDFIEAELTPTSDPS